MDPHAALLADLTRRGFLQRAAALGALIASAGPAALAGRAEALVPGLGDATLQAFYDTILPGRPATRTDLGNRIEPRAIAGVDNRPGAVEADALALGRHPKTGFAALEEAFLVELERRALVMGGPFLSLPFEKRVAVVRSGLEFSNPARVLWEAAAAVPFTAFCAAALNPAQTAAKASGYRVMGLPGRAPRGYRKYSYRRKLARERTKRGNLK